MWVPDLVDKFCMAHCQSAFQPHQRSVGRSAPTSKSSETERHTTALSQWKHAQTSLCLWKTLKTRQPCAGQYPHYTSHRVQCGKHFKASCCCPRKLQFHFANRHCFLVHKTPSTHCTYYHPFTPVSLEICAFKSSFSSPHSSPSGATFVVKPWRHRLNLVSDKHRRAVVVKKPNENRLI